ncbi:MAG: hypothetical protein OXF41_20700 [bacterium]|nr:hypothetical protein [bacterium]
MQSVILVLAPTVVIVAVTVRSARQGDSYLEWAVFAALVIGGLATAMQSGRVGRLGAGHLLITCATPSYIAISLIALEAGGPAMLATLTVVAAVCQFALAGWLPTLRRIVTPVVSGTVLMLIVVSVLPLAFDRFQEVPEGASPVAGPLVATVTLVVTAAMVLLARGTWRIWTSLIGIAAGCAISVPFGLYDMQRVIDASWLGLPDTRLPGLAPAPGTEFWALLPAFVILSVVLGIKIVGDGVVIQQVSSKRPGTTDYRVIQGVLNTNAAGVLLSGVAGTPPTTVYSASSAAIINLTGVAARSVGYGVGIILVALAFLPKVTAVLIAVPNPVMGAYLLFLMGLLFVEGMRTVVQDGLDQRKTLVVAFAFSIGVGVEYHGFFGQMSTGAWATSLDTGMTVGALVAVLMTLSMELLGRRPVRMRGPLGTESLPGIYRMLRDLSARHGWDAKATERLCSAGEETLLCLLQPGNQYESAAAPRLTVKARGAASSVDMEFLAVFVDENIEDHLDYLDEQSEVFDDREMSFRLLRHYASSVRHQKFYGMDVITVRVDKL